MISIHIVLKPFFNFFLLSFGQKWMEIENKVLHLIDGKDVGFNLARKS